MRISWWGVWMWLLQVLALQLLQMGKKPTSADPPKRISTRVIKKPNKPGEEDFYEEEDSPNSSHPGQDDDSPHDDQDSDESGSEGSDEEESDSEPTPELKPQNMAIRNMQFRERRGTKMNYLINRKKEEEEDPFWAEQGQQYFGNLDDGDNDEEDYVQSSSGRDQFDSDFDQTQSEHEDKQGEKEEQKEVDEDYQKQKKKRQELMRKIQAPAPALKKATRAAPSTISSKRPQKMESQKKMAPEASTRYIHQVFNQQQLLGEAATTQYFNWLSLKKLISIETEKKDFTKREHHVEGPRLIYRDRYNPEGIREVTYELEEVAVNNVQDLTALLRQI